MRRLRDDSGIAMVTAVLAVMVVSSLAVTGFGLATHNLDQSANERRSVQAIHAAEAGVDAFLRYLSTAPITGTACALPTESLPTGPPSSFTASATYYPDHSGSAPMTCPPASVPGAVLIHSAGTSAGKTRTMEAYYELGATPGGSTLYNGSVYSDGPATFNGQATMTGNPYGADLYSNGNVLLGGGGTIYGNAYAQGTLTLKGGTEVKQDAIAKLALDMQGGSIVRGNGRSSTAAISTANNSTIYGTAYYCTGSAPATGTPRIQECNSSLPGGKTWTNPDPAKAVQFTYNPSDWTNSADHYTIRDFNDPTACTSAQAFIATILSGNYVIRINSTCTLAWGGQSTINVNGNLAIISNGSLTMDSHALFTSTTSRKLYLMFNVTTPRPCSSVGISFNSQALIASTLDALLYTPCQVSFGAQSTSLRGQIVGGQVSFGAGANITTVPMYIPGPNLNGFQQSMTYRREVT